VRTIDFLDQHILIEQNDEDNRETSNLLEDRERKKLKTTSLRHRMKRRVLLDLNSKEIQNCLSSSNQQIQIT
jgi:hypothetical protein